MDINSSTTTTTTTTVDAERSSSGNVSNAGVDDVDLVRAILTGDATPTKPSKPPSDVPLRSRARASTASNTAINLNGELAATDATTTANATDKHRECHIPTKRKSPSTEKKKDTKCDKNGERPYTRRRKRTDVHVLDVDVEDLHIALDEFKRANHGLRLSASQIAAITGFHPYSNVPKLLMDLVYQGSIGNLLLKRDAKLLNVEIMSEEECLQRIARKAGVAVNNALQQSMDVSRGKKKVKSIQEATVLKEDIMSHVKKSKVLSRAEMKQLEEGIRYNVNTGFGKTHEDDALDLYEKQCGWEVRSRNDDMKCWKFMRAVENDVLTAVPFGPASSLYGREKQASNGGEPNSSKKTDCDNTVTKSYDKDTKCGDVSIPVDQLDTIAPIDTETNSARKLPNSPVKEVRVIEILSSDDEEEGDDDFSKCHGGERSQKSKWPFHTSDVDDKEKYFFCIVGVCDGICDELHHDLAPNTEQTSRQPNEPGVDDDDDTWVLRKVVIECKHRMKKAFIPPPLYDQIQAVVYCFMYNTSEGKIVQVVRNKEAEKKCDNTSNETSTKDVNPHDRTLDERKEDKAMQEKLERHSQPKSIKPRPKSIITSSRISLDDSVMQHRQNWYDVMLPRLRSVVEAVYSVRANDDKRYRMLHAASLASSGGDDKEWWEILFKECPWFHDCDTAFSRK